MIYKYYISSLIELGLPTIHIQGEKFAHLDLYELTGRKQYLTTFTLKPNSEAHSKYGRSLTGVIFYAPKTKNDLESALNSSESIELNVLKIDVKIGHLNHNEKHDLKYKGIDIDCIESITFLMYKPEIELHESGEKKIPNRIELKVDCSNINPDRLQLNHLLSEFRRGASLLEFEKDQLIGLLLAYDNFQVERKILDDLKLTLLDIQGNNNIWHNAYLALERQGKITAEREQALANFKSIDLLKRIKLATQELSRAGLNKNISQKQIETIEYIFNQAKLFKPSIIIYGTRKVYWDLSSYLHITLRHIKHLQIGNFTTKTPFLYKTEDLSSLIASVLFSVDDDLRDYLSSDPIRPFKRHGPMAIEFNGDYYHLSIEPSGRLAQFHMTEYNRKISI